MIRQLIKPRQLQIRPRVSPWMICAIPRYNALISTRFYSESSDNKPSQPASASGTPSTPEQIKIDKPTYQLTFTCKVCDNRSSHLVSKQAYHNGTVLIQCPSCKNRHLIADHLKIFTDKRMTLEDILAEKGTTITKSALDLENIGDIQWDDKESLQLEGTKQ